MTDKKNKKQSLLHKAKKNGCKRFHYGLGVIACLIASLLYSATLAAATVQGVKLAPSSEKTKILIDLDAPAGHHLFMLQNPQRVVIDIPKSKMSQWAKMPSGTGVITQFRHGDQADKLRLVADLKSSVLASSYIVQAKENSKARRLVIELDHAASKAGKVIAPVKSQDDDTRDVVVAIVAGHGGQDPGSIGPQGTHEKKVVAAIAKKLAAKINAEKGLKAHLVPSAYNNRKASFRERVKSARDQNADMFISIHADSFRDASVTGSSVYVLSQRGASSTTARWLANKVNGSDLVGGVSLKDKDNTLASVLLDLSQGATIAASTRLGQSMLDELASIGRVRKKEVQYANFAVLKSPDVPSILVETGYISNPDEERKLRNVAHQDKIAKAMFTGIKDYFTKNPPSRSVFSKKPKADVPKVYVAEYKSPATTNKSPATVNPTATKAKVATRSAKTEFTLKAHKIRSGESLSVVSARYNVTIQALKRINKLKSNNVRIGQVLQVPVSSS